jgi:hypothetical protein
MLDIPSLPDSARVCHIFPQLQNKVLLSIGQFCDSRYTATFTADTLHIYQGTTSHIQGTRNGHNGFGISI